MHAREGLAVWLAAGAERLLWGLRSDRCSLLRRRQRGQDAPGWLPRLLRRLQHRLLLLLLLLGPPGLVLLPERVLLLLLLLLDGQARAQAFCRLQPCTWAGRPTSGYLMHCSAPTSKRHNHAAA